MADQNKKPISGKVHKTGKNKFKIDKDKGSEVDVDIDVLEDGDYDVEKLSVDGLPTHMPDPDGTAIGWFNNFSIKQNGQPIKKKYKVKIAGISNMGKSKLVILDSTNVPRYFDGTIADDTFEYNDGDPAVGGSPPRS